MALALAGSFEMGDAMNEPEGWMERSKLLHKIELGAFYMNIYEATVEQEVYAREQIRL